MIRSRHQGCLRIWRTQTSDVFQSSWTSWSSKIIVVGTVDSSHRMSGVRQASQYRWQYSSKSATSLSGASLRSAVRDSMYRLVAGDTWSA